MVFKKIFVLALIATLARGEPPSPYHYNPPSTNYGAPIAQHSSQSYLPPNSYQAPRQHYGVPTQQYSPPNQNYNAPSQNYGAPSQNYGAPSQNYGGHDHHGHDNEVPKSYEFGYSVKDAQSGNDYGRKEMSDGNTVRGEYRVQLPDGRTQIVTYHADWQTGFHADVRYEGEAHYPEQSHGSSNAYLPPQQGYNNQQSNFNNYNAPSGFSGSLTGFHGSSRPSSSYGPPGYQH